MVEYKRQRCPFCQHADIRFRVTYENARYLCKVCGATFNTPIEEIVNNDYQAGTPDDQH